jgi:AcrR family transcriptional regulator
MTTTHDEHSTEPGLRERKKNQTRTAIHEAAFRLIDLNGLDATTIEQICLEADVSGRTFFNYYPSKAAAALDQREAVLDPAAQTVFRAASGGLVAALCEAIGSSAEVWPSHASVKQLVLRRPELMPHLSQMVIAVRGEFVSLAAERASSPEQAELAVGLVLAALGRVMHEDSERGVPLADQLRRTVRHIVDVAEVQLTDPV